MRVKDKLPSNQSDFLLYTGADGKVKVDGFLKRVGTARGGHWEICR